MPYDNHADTDHDPLNTTPTVMVNNSGITLLLPSDCTESTEASGHTIEEKTETVCCYSTLKETEKNGSKKEYAKPSKVVTEHTTENHICESGACESEKKTSKATCKTVSETVSDEPIGIYESKLKDTEKPSGV